MTYLFDKIVCIIHMYSRYIVCYLLFYVVVMSMLYLMLSIVMLIYDDVFAEYCVLPQKWGLNENK